MAKRIIQIIEIVLIATMLLILVSLEVRAEQISYKGYATAYCLPGITASGQEVHPGICAMNSKVVKEFDLMGKDVALYQRLPNGEKGKLIGIYEIADTGCKKNVIDVWMPDLKQCQKFMNLVYEDGCKGKIYYEVIEDELVD